MIICILAVWGYFRWAWCDMYFIEKLLGRSIVNDKSTDNMSRYRIDVGYGYSDKTIEWDNLRRLRKWLRTPKLFSTEYVIAKVWDFGKRGGIPYRGSKCFTEKAENVDYFLIRLFDQKNHEKDWTFHSHYAFQKENGWWVFELEDNYGNSIKINAPHKSCFFYNCERELSFILDIIKYHRNLRGLGLKGDILLPETRDPYFELVTSKFTEKQDVMREETKT